MTSTGNATSHSITGLILAGGRATRMQNRDKGLQELNGKSMVTHVIARLAPQVAAIAINANRYLDDYALLGFPVWPDALTNNELDYAGPLAGLATGLTHCKTPYLLTVPCDSPFLPLDLAARLMAALQQQHAEIAIACTGDQNHPQAQPVFCLVHTPLLNQLQHYLALGGRKMDGWYGNVKVSRVYFADDAEFKNINTLEELQACSTLLAPDEGEN